LLSFTQNKLLLSIQKNGGFMRTKKELNQSVDNMLKKEKIKSLFQSLFYHVSLLIITALVVLTFSFLNAEQPLNWCAGVTVGFLLILYFSVISKTYQVYTRIPQGVFKFLVSFFFVVMYFGHIFLFISFAMLFKWLYFTVVFKLGLIPVGAMFLYFNYKVAKVNWQKGWSQNARYYIADWLDKLSE
jgi:hypothetical protein